MKHTLGKRGLSLVLAMMMALFFFAACGGGGGDEGSNPPPSNDSTIELLGGAQPDDLTITAFPDQYGVDDDGTFTKPVSQETQMVFSTYSEGGVEYPYLMGLNLPGSKSFDLNARTTAIAMVLMNPLLVKITAADSGAAEQLIDYVDGLNSLGDLVSLIESKLDVDPKALSYDDQEIRDAVIAVVTDVINYLQGLKFQQVKALAALQTSRVPAVALSVPKAVTPSEPAAKGSGLNIHEFVVDDLNSVVHFTHSRKRWVAVYEHYNDGSYDSTLPVVFMHSIGGLFDGLLTSLIEWDLFPPVESDEFDVNFASTNKHYYRAFGLGVHGWDALETEAEIGRWMMPAMFTAGFDFVMPTIELIGGFKTPKTLQGKPNSAAFTALLETLVKDWKTYPGLAEKIIEKDIIGFISKFTFIVMAKFVEEPKLMLDILKEVGIGGALAVAKSAVLPLKIISIVQSGSELGFAIVGFGLSYNVVDFEVYRSDPDGSVVGEFPEFTPDPSDYTEFSVVQTTPTNGATGVDPNTPVNFYFDDEIDPATVSGYSVKVNIKDSGEPIYGTFTGSLSSAGNTIMTLVPFKPWPEGETIVITLLRDLSGLLDDGSNTINTEYVLEFTTTSSVVYDGDLGFETGITGWNTSGDVGVISSFGPIAPYQGSQMLAVTSGNQLVSSGFAVNGTTSTATSGQISVPAGATSVTVRYNFISAEFDEYVGSVFDDTFAINVVGPGGSLGGVINSVNTIGTTGSYPVTLPSYLTSLESQLSDVDQTGWLSVTFNISGLGNNITLSVTTSDVGDSAYSTIVLIDAISFN